MSIRLFNNDCMEVLSALEIESVDAVITDPPYTVYLTSQTKKTPAYKKLHNHKWHNTMSWIKPVYRLTKNGGVLYSFTNDNDISYLRLMIEGAGYRVYQRLHWIKTNPLPSYTKHNYRGGVELAFYCVKGDKPNYFAKRTQQELLGYWMLPIVGGNERTEHPTQKPLEIIKTWVENSCPPDGLVLDPFMGSGTTGVACVQTGRNFIGIEIEPNYYEIAKKRIAQAQMQIRMPI